MAPPQAQEPETELPDDATEPLSGVGAQPQEAEGSFADRIEAELNASFDSLSPEAPEDTWQPEETADPVMDPASPTPEVSDLAAEEFASAPEEASNEFPEPVEPELDEESATPTVFGEASDSVDAGFDAPTFDEAPLDTSGFADETDDSPLGAPAQLDPESERRIQELLDEGQQAVEQKEYQSAIDSWSRVFLIDIDHEEANQRIEDARRMAAEAERQVEEVFHEAMSCLDEGDLEASREALNRVLEMQPGHLAAVEYLERIESGDVAPPPTEVASPQHDEVGTDAGFDLEDSADFSSEDSGEQDLFTTPDIAPLAGADLEPVTAPVVPPPPPQKRDPRRLFISVGSLVLVLVLLGGWFLRDNWSRFFPNSQSAQDVPAPQRIDPIRRAKALHEQGKTAIAIAQLRRLPPGDPYYTEAQALVAQWEIAPVDSVPQGPTSGEMDRFRALLANAGSAQAANENLLVVEFLSRAASIAPLDQQALVDLAAAEAELANLRDQIQVFRSGDWEYALPALWRMREADISNADVNRLIIDSYYNLGVRDLQRGRPESASKKFEEALNLRPNDKTLARLHAFSETYQERPEDLLYRIFVKYLPFR